MKRPKTPWIVLAAILAAAATAYYGWRTFGAPGLPDGIASGNGRIEATEIDISSRTAGRVAEILVREGDFVTAGQVVARMDTGQLEAQLREARAQLRRATIAVDTARDQVVQRNAEKAAAVATVAQRQAELDAARRRLQRTTELAGRGTAAQQVLDDDRAAFEGAKAAVSVAEAQVAAVDAAINTARSQVIDAEAMVEAAEATIARIQVDIEDSALKAPSNGRIQYRVAQPGEVVSAGAALLNLVVLEDVFMTFFLPTEQAGRVPIGAEVRLVLDAAPQWVIPARATFVADVAQFTPKTVETEEERQNLMFRVRAHIPPELLRENIEYVKTGLPGVAYVRLDPEAEWPPELQGPLVQ